MHQTLYRVTRDTSRYACFEEAQLCTLHGRGNHPPRLALDSEERAEQVALCEEAQLGQVDRALFWGRQFLNPFAFYGLDGPAGKLAERAAAIRAAV